MGHFGWPRKLRVTQKRRFPPRLPPAFSLPRLSTNHSVLLAHNATPQTILQFHDELSNKLPALKGKWSFAFKIFRNNVYSIPPELAASATTSPQTAYLHTWSPSYLNDACVTLINKESVGVFSHVVDEELPAPDALAIPNHHLHSGATTGLNDSFDYVINQRMQSMWTQRQAIRGDGGHVYELANGNLVFRTANVSLHGNFRGFLIQIEVHSKIDGSREAEFHRIIEKYGLPEGSLNYLVLDPENLDEYGDLTLQYAEILNF